MTGYLKGKAVGQVDALLINGKVLTEEQIKEAMKDVPEIKKGKKRRQR